jgi:DNA invertase Pin-like site-specific DNA recombinase
MTGRTVGYARITGREDATVTAALQAAGCTEVHLEPVTATRAARTIWTSVRSQLNGGDALVVMSLTDLNWATVRLVQMLDDLQRTGVRFRAIAESIDSAHTGYAAVIDGLARLPGHVAQLRARVAHTGLRARGRHGGRPPALTADQAAEARALYDQGHLTGDAIAARFGVSRSTLYRHLPAPTEAATTPKGTDHR